MDDELLGQAPVIADLLRSHRNDGGLAVNRDEAIELLTRLIYAAHSAGAIEGSRETADRMMTTFDRFLERSL